MFFIEKVMTNFNNSLPYIVDPLHIILYLNNKSKREVYGKK